ncbi:four helix bundle protein [Ectothiorhodospiraceae bacterium BW-2]|nr:four helix bundle protein [Ectothiorhodospiraceae bacterium BW-2]
MAHHLKLPIWRDANQLLLEIEQAVARFPRYHKYAIGTDMRRQAMALCRQIVLAANQRPQQPQHIEQLSLEVDELKVMIQLAKSLKAFQNFAQFQRCVELAVSVGKQSGGWLRHLHAAQNGRQQ